MIGQRQPWEAAVGQAGPPLAANNVQFGLRAGARKKAESADHAKSERSRRPRSAKEKGKPKQAEEDIQV